MRRRILAAAAVAAACAPTAPAQAATPTHVAIVVTYKGTTVARCAPVKSSGLADLQSRFTVVVGQPPSPYTGFVFTIDGHGTTHPDDTHYWAYYHRVNGSWVYSSVGAASYRPAAGAVEGWAYDNGSQTPPKPPSRTYSSVCGSTATTPSPATTPAAAPPPAPRTPVSSPAAARTSRARPAPVPSHGTVDRPAQRASSSPARISAVRPHRAATSPTRARPPGHRRVASARPAPAPVATQHSGPATATSSPAAAPRRASAAPWAPLTALAVVAALGGGAWWRLHGRGRA